MAKKRETVIANTLKSLHVKKVVSQKGWTREEAASKIKEYLMCGKGISLAEFLRAA